MFLGILTFILALGAAGYLLYCIAEETRNPDARTQQIPASSKMGQWLHNKENLLKLIILFTICAALFTTKLWPLAVMLLIAAGCITAVEFWKQKALSEIEILNQQGPGDHSAGVNVTISEAREVLGLEEGASAQEIRAAHKKLITQLHPDHGGTTYLAAKINESRAILLAAINKKTD